MCNQSSTASKLPYIMYKGVIKGARTGTHRALIFRKHQLQPHPLRLLDIFLPDNLLHKSQSTQKILKIQSLTNLLALWLSPWHGRQRSQGGLRFKSWEFISQEILWWGGSEKFFSPASIRLQSRVGLGWGPGHGPG